MKLVTAKEMRFAERKLAEAGLSEQILMENAAMALFNEIIKQNPSRVAVVTGKGQNAGDGFALARLLFAAGINTAVLELADEDDYRGAALQNYKIMCSLGVLHTEFSEAEILNADVVAECICGTGFHGELAGKYKAAANTINRADGYVISADVPLGVNSDTGEADKNSVKADKTVTFGYAKRGLYSPLSADFTGDVKVCGISVPNDTVNTDINLVDKNDIVLPILSRGANKGTMGKTLVAGGSLGMLGAPCLAAYAAQLCGTGTVTVAAPHDMALPLMSRLTCAMYKDIDSVDFENYDSVLIGNGMGNSLKTQRTLQRAIKNCRGKLVIDADAINALADDTGMLNGHTCDIIITPHPKEFSRLTGIDVEEVLCRRIELAVDFAKKYNVILVLKTAFTVVAAPGGKAYINSTGNEGMATGGSGDVLAGMTAGLAPRLSALESAKTAVFLHGAAGDFAAAKLGKASVTAASLADNIPDAFSLFEKN